MTIALVPEAMSQDRPGPLLEVSGLRLERLVGGGRQTIVSSIDLSLSAGETIGIVGESGSGKSMTAKAILGLLPPSVVADGVVTYGGRDVLALSERHLRSIRGREIGLILQDPFTMLNPVRRCSRILEESFLHGRGRRMGAKQRRAEAVRRLAEVGIKDETVADRYPFQLSGGMRQRVAIAAALARDPRVLIADEPSTALDVTTQREILALLQRVQEARGMGLILITHDLRIAFSICDRIYVLYAGSLLEVTPAAEGEAEPLHPYTHGLLLSEPPMDRRVRELIAIPGSVPDPDDVAGCCSFAPRCRWAREVCRDSAPPLRQVVPGRLSACVRIPEIRAEMAALRERVEENQPVHVHDRSAETLVAVRNVLKRYPSGKREVLALEDVSIEVGANESVGVVGESGSGKTTLARILVGLETASRGSVVIGGVDASDWTKLSKAERSRLRGDIQIVFQDPYSSLNPRRTVGAALSEAITTHTPRSRRVAEQVEALLTSVGLPAGYAQRKPVALSGGERQRVAIARALAVRPKILVCDEPVSALDVSVQAQVLNLLASLKADYGLAYLFISHDLSIIRQIVERIYVMHRGRVVESGPVNDVLENPRDSYTIQLLQSIPRSQSTHLTSP